MFCKQVLNGIISVIERPAKFDVTTLLKQDTYFNSINSQLQQKLYMQYSSVATYL